MAASISLTEQQIVTALRTVLISILPNGMPIIRSQVNRVAEPLVADFVMMTPSRRTRLATNIDTFIDEPAAQPPIGQRNSLAKMELVVQLDVHGPSGADNAQMIATLMRDEYATIAFTATGIDAQPLYCSEPLEAPFDNAEQQTEWRWTLDVCLQANIVVTTPQDFADVVEVDTISVDTLIPVP